MDWLKRWLAPRTEQAEAKGVRDCEAVACEDPVAITSYRDRFLHLPDLDFFGLNATSASGRFKLAWRDSNDEHSHGGYRESGHGLCLLLDQGEVVVRCRAERPNDGKVADNGTFIVNDWLFGGELNGRLRAFDAAGAALLDHLFAANLLNNGLSSDGRFAVCQTASAPGSADDTILALFDLAERCLLASWQPEPGTAEAYEFDIQARELIAHYRDGERVRFSFEGTMIDRASWLQRRIVKGDVFVIAGVIHGGDEWRQLADEMLAGLDLASREHDMFLERSRALRLKGELLEKLERPNDALDAYDRALILDPQVGVSRRAQVLRKLLRPDEARSTARMGRFARHAQKLGIEHEVVMLEAGEVKQWRHRDDHPWSGVEEAALRHYEAEGWIGVAAEGGLVLTLIKAASFPAIEQRNADTFIEALYAQNVAFEQDRFDADRMIDCVRSATLAQIKRNWLTISATAGQTPAYYPRVFWEHVEGLFEHLGRERLADIARAFSAAPYDHRAGWPDLTLWRDGEVRFIEVKSPNDQLHASQSRLISAILVPLGHRTGIAEVRKTPA